MSEWIDRDDRDPENARSVILTVEIITRLTDDDGIEIATLHTFPNTGAYIEPQGHLSDDLRPLFGEDTIDDIGGALDAIAQRATWGREGVAP